MRPTRKFSQHAEWRSLIEIAGPFLSDKALKEAFPQGLDKVQTPKKQRLRSAYEEWRDALDQRDPALPELHREWVSFVLRELLEYDEESLVAVGKLPEEQRPQVMPQERSGRLAADVVVRSPQDGSLRLLVCVVPPGTDLEKAHGDQWSLPLHERLTLLCRQSQVRLGLLTNGERWMLVNAPVGSTSGHASWYARLWFQEPVTLQAFQSLFSVRRCFGPSKETFDALLQDSLEHHDEITNTLGEQVRRAVEVLVQCLDKADADRNRELLQDVTPAELYEAGLTVMMRLVFTLCAEERGLLLLGDETYDQFYAASSLRAQLTEDADRHGAEVLERRHDAWARLLALFRAVHGGVEHENLRLPALGGSLFDPDRFPFLEGRPKGSRWRQDAASPLPIDNRTVLLLLNSLQVLEQSGGARLLSYRALDVEQIGHVYEGLLEQKVARTASVTLGLEGTKKAKNAKATLLELEATRELGEAKLLELLNERTLSSESALKKALAKAVPDSLVAKVLGVCGGDLALVDRIKPFVHLIRLDAWGEPVIYRAGSFMVTLGQDRRETGAHYTPRALTEPIVQHTLDPLVYVGPAVGHPQDQWQLKSSRELLDLKICDMAMGSGAFLVQACRYLAEKVVAAWTQEEASGHKISVDGEILESVEGQELLPLNLEERLTLARRIVAERCLYGVDINPLAVELAKLSLWLITLAKGRPFGFLDSNLRCGDSLLGIHRLDQLTTLSMNPDTHAPRLFGRDIEAAVKEVMELRQQIRSIRVRDIHDIERKARLNEVAHKKLAAVELLADAMVGEVFAAGGQGRMIEASLAELATQVEKLTKGADFSAFQLRIREMLSGKRLLHWALEFPEVFERKGFDGVIGNPPFLGGKRISQVLGDDYNAFLKISTSGSIGAADLCAYFFRRAFDLLDKAGTAGLVATNTISQADTREVGLDILLVKGATFFRAVSLVIWPGAANVHASTIYFTRMPWNGTSYLDGQKIHRISSNLSEYNDKIARKLKSTFPCASGGTGLLGIGFVIDVELHDKWTKNDGRYHEILFPYINGQELNNTPDFSPQRYVINFENRDESEAEMYPLAISRIRDLVRPQRDVLTRQIHETCYWKHWDKRDSLYTAINSISRVLVCSFVSKHLPFTFLPKNWVYSKELAVIPSDDAADFAILQSSFHAAWARFYSGTLKSDLSYSISDALRTFPMPIYNISQCRDAGEKYFIYRNEVMLSRNEGLTKIYNRFHDQSEQSDDIARLRSLHIQLDQAVANAYGLSNLDLCHGFHITKQGERYTLSESARRTVLAYLLELNNERAAEEATVPSPKATKARAKKAASDSGHAEFDFGQAPTDPQQAITAFLSQNPGPHPKAAILSATGVTDTQWTKAIKVLVDGGLVKQEGEKKGARYFFQKNGEE